MGRIASFSRFLAASAQQVLPFFALLKKENNFEWKSECEAVFREFKNYLFVALRSCAKPSLGVLCTYTS